MIKSYPDLLLINFLSRNHFVRQLHFCTLTIDLISICYRKFDHSAIYDPFALLQEAEVSLFSIFYDVDTRRIINLPNGIFMSDIL